MRFRSLKKLIAGILFIIILDKNLKQLIILRLVILITSQKFYLCVKKSL